MSEASKGTAKIGPDYFGYYTHQVVELLSQHDDFLPFNSQTSDLSRRKCEEVIGNNPIESRYNISGSLYSNCIGAGLSDFKQERLKALLRQGVIVLSPEVDEMLDPVLNLSRLRYQVRRRKRPLSPMGAASNGDAEQVPRKKVKNTETPRERTCLEEPKEKESHLESKIGTEEEKEEEDDILQFFIENNSLEVEETVKKYSDEMSATLGHMEQQLEELLDTVMSKCRPMTLTEKQQLRKLIQKLPPKNLDRVVEIIRRGKLPEAQSCDEIFVDLEKEDNITLWRLYYYIEAVNRASTLSL